MSGASQVMPAGKPPGHYLGGSRSDPVWGDWALVLACAQLHAEFHAHDQGSESYLRRMTNFR